MTASQPIERYTEALAALALVALSIDESVAVHESVSRKLQLTTPSPFEHLFLGSGSACGLEVMTNFVTYNSPLYKVEARYFSVPTIT